MIDLHMHSIHSDGSETPSRLVELGRESGLRAMALTDHDNMDGTVEFLAACSVADITGIAGIELSALVEPSAGTLHLLGYGLNPRTAGLQERLTLVRHSRQERNQRILQRFNELGIPLTWREVLACAGKDTVGRVHFARALLVRGVVGSVSEAFARYLSKGGPAYSDRYRLSAEQCISMIRAAGGIAAIAHPYTWLTHDDLLESGLRRLKEAGLVGIEVYHSEHNLEQSVALLRLAQKLALLPTGGSDYHGVAKPNVALGRGHGNLHVPADILPPLLTALEMERTCVME